MGQASPSCIHAAECGLFMYTYSQRLIACVDLPPNSSERRLLRLLCKACAWMGGSLGCGHKMLARERNRMSSADIGGVAP